MSPRPNSPSTSAGQQSDAERHNQRKPTRRCLKGKWSSSTEVAVPHVQSWHGVTLPQGGGENPATGDLLASTASSRGVTPELTAEALRAIPGTRVRGAGDRGGRVGRVSAGPWSIHRPEPSQSRPPADGASGRGRVERLVAQDETSLRRMLDRSPRFRGLEFFDQEQQVSQVKVGGLQHGPGRPRSDGHHANQRAQDGERPPSVSDRGRERPPAGPPPELRRTCPAGPPAPVVPLSEARGAIR